MNQTVFVLDLWDKFSPDKVISKFRINDRWWAIKEVPLEWGEPQLSKIEEDSIPYHLYETEAEAREYVRKIKHLEGVNL